MRNRRPGKERAKINLFIYPDLQYMVEQMAIQAGFVRKCKGRLNGRPDVGAMLEQWLIQTTNINKCTAEQRQQMETYQNWVNEQRAKGIM